jgi:acyl carrier protein
MSSSAVPPEQPLVLREHLPLPRCYVAPRTLTELRLAEIWRTVLNMDCVGAEDSYYDLGGDSFLATIIFSMIEETFRVTIPMAILVDASTIAKLGQKIDALLSYNPNGRV